MAAQRIAFDKAIKKFRGADEWSPHAIHVPILAHDTKRMLFIRTTQDHDTPNQFCWPTVGLRHGEVVADGIERALAKIGYYGPKGHDWWQIGFLRFHQPKGHIGLLAPLVMVRSRFNPDLSCSGGDYDDFCWRRPLDVNEHPPENLSYVLNEVLDHHSSADHLASVLANVR